MVFWCTRSSYYPRKLNMIWKKIGMYAQYLVLSIMFYNLIMNLIGEINVCHGLQLSLHEDT